MQVGEITTPAPRHQNFLTDLVRAFQYDDTPTALTGDNRAHQAGRATAQDNDIEVAHLANIANSPLRVRNLTQRPRDSS